MLYIPITFKVNGRPVSNAFQAVIAAEGIAPFAAKTFLGMGGGRSDPPRLTGAHPLNPFEDRVLLYSKLPKLPDGEKFSDIWHMTAFVCVEDNEVRFVGGSREDLTLQSDLVVKQSSGAVFFTNPQNIAFIFADDTNHDYRMGLRATPCGKHDDVFCFRVLGEDGKDGDELCNLTEDDIEKIASLKLNSDGDTVKMIVAESEFEERYQGAELGYGLSLFCAESSHVAAIDHKRKLWGTLKVALEGLLPSKDAEKHRKSIAKSIAQCYKKSHIEDDKNSKFSFSRLMKSIPEKWQRLIMEYCRLLCSHPFTEWNWADNEMRAEFSQKVLDRCIVPTLRESGGNQWVDVMRHEMALVKRRFNEPYTFLLEDKMLRSSFVIAFWWVMNSEGRHDRIREAMMRYAGDEKSFLALALYGAMCGYAGMSTKRLAITSETSEGPTLSDWIESEVLEKKSKTNRTKAKNKSESTKKTQKKVVAMKTVSSKEVTAAAKDRDQMEFSLGG